MSSNGERYSLEQALDEAEKLKLKVDSGEAAGYAEAEQQLEATKETSQEARHTREEIKKTVKDQEKEKLQTLILDELRAVKEKKGENWYSYFNNLWLRLPDDTPYFGNYRKASIEGGKWNRKRSEYLKDDEFYNEEMQMHSALRNNQTDEEFFQTIDHKIKELGISEDKIQELVNQLKSGLPRRAMIELYTMLETLYVELRVLGYNHQDLVG